MAAENLGLVIGIEVKDGPAVSAISRTGKQLDQLEKTANKTKQAMQKAANDPMSSFSGLDGKISGLIGSFGKLAGVLGVAFAGREILQTVDAVDALSDAATGLNTNFQGLQTLKQVFTLGGADPENVQQMLSKLNDALGQVKDNGDTAGESFRRLGLSFKDFDGLQSDKQLVLLLDSVSKLSSETDKAAILSDIFGKQYAQAMRLAKAGVVDLANSVRDSGKILGEDQVAAIEKAKDAQDKLNASWELAKMKITASLAKPLEQVLGLLEKIADKASNIDLTIPFKGYEKLYDLGVEKANQLELSKLQQLRSGELDNLPTLGGEPDVKTLSNNNPVYENLGENNTGKSYLPNYGREIQIDQLNESINPNSNSGAGTKKLGDMTAGLVSDFSNLRKETAGLSKKDFDALKKSAANLAKDGFDEALKSITKMKNKIDDYFSSKEEDKTNKQLDQVFKAYEGKQKDVAPESFRNDQFNNLASDLIGAQKDYEANNNDMDAYQRVLEGQSAIEDLIAGQKERGYDTSSWEGANAELNKFTNNVPKDMMPHQKVDVNISVEPNDNFWIKWSTDSKAVNGLTSLMTNIAASAAAAGAK